jgi:hypothetical protein
VARRNYFGGIIDAAKIFVIVIPLRLSQSNIVLTHLHWILFRIKLQLILPFYSIQSEFKIELLTTLFSDFKLTLPLFIQASIISVARASC